MINYIILYNAIYLKHWKLVTNEALPSLNNLTTQEMSYIFEVNGAAIDASASDRDMPTSAAFKAPQSLAPSPHIPHKAFLLIFWRWVIN